VHRHWRAHLQPALGTAPSAPNFERQPARTLVGGDHLGKRQDRPSVARRAVRVKLVVAGVQSGNVP